MFNEEIQYIYLYNPEIKKTIPVIVKLDESNMIFYFTIAEKDNMLINSKKVSYGIL